MPENAQKYLNMLQKRKLFLQFEFLFSGSILYQEKGIFFSEIDYSESVNGQCSKTTGRPVAINGKSINRKIN